MVNPPQPRQQSPRASHSQLSSKHSPSISHNQSGHSTTPHNLHLHHTSSTSTTISSTSTNSSMSSSNQSSHGHAHTYPHGHNHPHVHPHNHPSRKPSIVELLSSPPPLPVDQDDSIHHLSLSRNPSISSRTSGGSFNPFNSGNGNIHNTSQSQNQSQSQSQGYSSNTAVDWDELLLTEVVEPSKLVHIPSSYSVQAAFETLVKNDLTSIPVSVSKDDPDDLRNCLTFDYSDLNTYLLLIMNKIDYNELNVDEIGDEKTSLQEKHDIVVQAINKAKKGEEVPVEFIIKLHPKNPFIKFTQTDTLFSVMETLGNGVHRVAITNEEGTKITGILSQRRLIKYMWENARRFPSLEFYFQSTLQDLKIGSNNPITIYEDQPVLEALHKMFNENVSSLAVIDRSKNLIGNISIVDVRNLTSSKNSHLLYKSVLNFISYNLTQKGIEEGQDQFPIFHVNNQSSLGRVIAKLVATQSHRLWVVDTSRKASCQSSQSSPAPNSGLNSGVTIPGVTQPTDASITNKAAAAASVEPSSSSSPMSNNPAVSSTATLTAIATTLSSSSSSHHNSIASSSSSSSSVCAVGAGVATTSTVQQETGYTGGTGKLIGVVTLTDILGLFATIKGRRTNPQSARNQRRRSSTSTTRSSIDSIENTLSGGNISGNLNNGGNALSPSQTTSLSSSSSSSFQAPVQLQQAGIGPRGSSITDSNSEIFRKQFIKPQENAFSKE
ncbi:SDS23 [Candida oxycetoniae]|uniref:SDS23 n=1 Tax=Candida oxycetoniae TaxID=497107 RepID=A0AAI9WXK3_9ASCO|nr:SDS23 [Candida oxycetoniae]KAI3404332.2 SDS23 [Candida oxycetoniae]